MEELVAKKVKNLLKFWIDLDFFSNVWLSLGRFSFRKIQLRRRKNEQTKIALVTTKIQNHPVVVIPTMKLNAWCEKRNVKKNQCKRKRIRIKIRKKLFRYHQKRRRSKRSILTTMECQCYQIISRLEWFYFSPLKTSFEVTCVKFFIF